MVERHCQLIRFQLPLSKQVLLKTKSASLKLDEVARLVADPLDAAPTLWEKSTHLRFSNLHHGIHKPNDM